MFKYIQYSILPIESIYLNVNLNYANENNR